MRTRSVAGVAGVASVAGAAAARAIAAAVGAEDCGEDSRRSPASELLTSGHARPAPACCSSRRTAPQYCCSSWTGSSGGSAVRCSSSDVLFFQALSWRRVGCVTPALRDAMRYTAHDRTRQRLQRHTRQPRCRAPSGVSGPRRTALGHVPASWACGRWAAAALPVRPSGRGPTDSLGGGARSCGLGEGSLPVAASR